MSVKTCFKCGIEKPRNEYYKHSIMKDGLLGKCKDCTKSDVKEHREKNIERVRAYDRARGSRQTDDYRRENRIKYPKKYLAKSRVNNALRDGRLSKKSSCSECGSGRAIHGHHDDYNKPLEVRWLCAACHRQWHIANGEGANAT